MQRLIIRLGSKAHDPIHWLVFSEHENEIIASGQLNSADELSSLKERASSADIIALAPSSDIYFTNVPLPKKGARKALSAIPFMVEEELASNIEDLFFALGENKNDVQEVAVVAKSKLKQWQLAFEQAGLFCQQLIPDAYCLPLSEHLNLLQIGDQLLAKMPDGKCLQGELDWVLPISLELAQHQELNISCFSEIDNWPATQEAEFDFDHLPMQSLLKGAEQAKLNLFQGEYAVKRTGNPTWNKWKLAAMLAIVAVCANLLYTTTELNSIKTQRAEVRQRTVSAVSQDFPNLGAYRFLRTAVEKEMLKLEQGGGNLSMLAMLSRLSTAFEGSDVKPQNIRYDSKRSEIRMQSVAGSFEALEKFKRDAQTLGFEVEQGAFNNRGSEVVGMIVVKG